MSVPPIIYVGDQAFADKYTPVSGKSEWGMDTLTRAMIGSQPLEVAFIQSLAQGQIFVWNFNNYYLQSWESDNEQVFPTVTLLYKGLNNGIPPPFVTGETMEQTSSATTSSPVTITFFDYETQGPLTKDVTGTRTTRYLTRSAKYKYITSARPTSPTYTTLDVPMAPIVLQSNITTDAGVNYATNAPAALATALAPSISNETTTNCSPVFGSPFFECEDSVMQYYN